MASDQQDPLYDITAERADAYRMAFSGPHGLEVLLDLADFCKAYESRFSAMLGRSGQTDPYLAAYYAGRYDVYARILKWSKLDPHMIYQTLIKRGVTHG